MVFRRRGSPVTVMMLALAVGLLVGTGATVLALAQPWLGIAFLPVSGGSVHLADAPGSPAILKAFPNGPRAPVQVLAIAAEGRGAEAMPLQAEDLAPEPGDALPTYDALAAFTARQSALAGLLRDGTVRLHLRDAAGAEGWAAISPASGRPPGDLPPVFWFQLAVGIAGLLLSCWVWALRRGDWGARLFALAGLAMLTFTAPAAVYSTRELALDGRLLRLLMDINAIGALVFGAVMTGVFLCYPRRLVRPVVLLIPILVFGSWLGAHLLRLPSSVGLGAHVPVMLEMLCIVLAIGLQWWATRRDPAGRAALRWLGLSVILGAGAFVTMMSTTVMLGIDAPMPQGYAFGFFLLIHAGLALGLRRYRLFELGDWAFRVMLVTLGLLALLLVDAALIVILQLDHNVALSLSLLAIGFLYLPMRDVLLRRLLARRIIPDHELFGMVMDVAFASATEERAAEWRGLLRRLFDPLEIATAGVAVDRPSVEREGLVMRIPPTAGADALVLSYPWSGRGLFTPAQLAMATRLCELMARAESGRDAYARGANSERLRIARDLHDDLGACLLAALRQPDLPGTRGLVREAMADVRTIVSGLSGDRLPLGQVLGDLRHETGQRLEGTGIALDWPVTAEPAPFESLVVDYPVYRTVTATVREAVSNAVRHSAASRLSVSVTQWEDTLRIAVEDDGRGLVPGAASPYSGHGLVNMARRAAELGGTLVFPEVARGARLDLTLPLPFHLLPAGNRTVEEAVAA